MEAPHDGRQDLPADGLKRADAEGPGGAGRERREIGLRRLEARDDRFGVAEEQHARLGQRDRPRPAGPFDEPLADDSLERRDLLADGRLRVAEPVRGAAERPLLGDGLQRREVPELDAEPAVGG